MKEQDPLLGGRPTCPHYVKGEGPLRCTFFETVSEMMREADQEGRPYIKLPSRAVGLCRRPAIEGRRAWVKFPVPVDPGTGHYLLLKFHQIFGFRFYTRMGRENRPCRDSSQKTFNGLHLLLR